MIQKSNRQIFVQPKATPHKTSATSSVEVGASGPLSHPNVYRAPGYFLSSVPSSASASTKYADIEGHLSSKLQHPDSLRYSLHQSSIVLSLSWFNDIQCDYDVRSRHAADKILRTLDIIFFTHVPRIYDTYLCTTNVSLTFHLNRRPCARHRRCCASRPSN